MLLAIDRKTRREGGGRRSSDSMSTAGDPEGRSGASWIGQPQDLTRTSIAEAVHLARELDGPGPHNDQVVIHAELHLCTADPCSSGGSGSTLESGGAYKKIV